MPTVRKIVMLREQVFNELGEAAASGPVTRVAALAVIANPFAGRFVANLEPLWLIGRKLGDMLMPELAALLGARAVSYGKGALVGVHGEMEHGGGCIHPMLGRPMRDAIGGGKAVIPSNVKVAAAGAALDLPLGHKDDPWSFAHFDTMTVTVADAPRPDEIVVALALADGGRLNNRCGERPVAT
jgi:Amino acid synthesis